MCWLSPMCCSHSIPLVAALGLQSLWAASVDFLALRAKVGKREGWIESWGIYPLCFLPTDHYCRPAVWQQTAALGGQPSVSDSKCSLLWFLLTHPAQVISPSVPPSALGFSYSLTLSLQMSFIRLITNYSRLLVISFLLGPSLIQNPNPRECGSTRQILHCMGWALELMPLSPSPARNFLYLIRRHSAWHTSHCHGSGGWTTVPHRQNTEGSGRESLTGSQREKGKAFSRRNRILWWEHSESTQ